MTAVRRYDIHLVDLEPTRAAEIQKTRPCVIISPDEMNRHLHTVIVAPLTSTRRAYPTRVDVTLQRRKGQVVLDQIRTVDRTRLVKHVGRLPEGRAREVARLLCRMFAWEG